VPTPALPLFGKVLVCAGACGAKTSNVSKVITERAPPEIRQSEIEAFFIKSLLIE
jgi:hypothetical protein